MPAPGLGVSTQGVTDEVTPGDAGALWSARGELAAGTQVTCGWAVRASCCATCDVLDPLWQVPGSCRVGDLPGAGVSWAWWAAVLQLVVSCRLHAFGRKGTYSCYLLLCELRWQRVRCVLRLLLLLAAAAVWMVAVVEEMVAAASVLLRS